MYKEAVNTSTSPKVMLEIQGDLALSGWDEPRVEVRCDKKDDITIEQNGDDVRVICQRDCTVRAPYGARLQIKYVHGHTAIKSMDGEISIQEASGHVSLGSIGPTNIERVHGNLAAKNVAGELRVQTLDGNAVVKDVQGDFRMENAAHGNLSLDDVEGNAMASCDGNLSLRLDPAPGKRYSFETGGNLICRLPGDASVAVDVREAAQIMLSHSGIEGHRVKAPHTFTLGDGEAELTLAAKGNVILGGQGWDWGFEGLYFEPGEDFDRMAEEINRQVGQQIQAQMEMLEHTLEAQLANIATVFEGSGLSAEKAERVAEKARAASERAQAKMQRAQAKLQRKLEAARRRAERRARTAAAKAGRDRRKRAEAEDWSPQPATSEAEPVTDEEQVMILKMLEQGQITTDEAEQLLAALEG